MLHPDLKTFKEHAHPGALVPVYRELIADLETPVAAYLKVSEGATHSFLLESVEHTGTLGRYSFIGANPSVLCRATRNAFTVVRNGVEERTSSENPLFELRKLMQAYEPVKLPGLPEFHGGAVGYLAYDAVRYFERLPDNNPDTLGLPDLCFMITDTLVVFDHVSNRMKIVCNVHVGDDADAAYAEAETKIAELEAKLLSPCPLPPLSPSDISAPPTTPANLTSNFTREGYCDAVRKAKEYIAAGDVFQVVLSQRFTRPVSASPVTLYRALRCVNPSPYMVLMQFPEFALVGSSPEVMTQVKNGTCMVRPIAGTRPRGANLQEDLAHEADLLADEKEIAEHVMLVDLGRNDLGRVSDPGTVAPVPQKRMVIERYSHVMHIVSEVVGNLRKELDAFDAIAATFPMGTVSGAPKIRAMQIIDELEPQRRGPYSGGCGYISFSGEMDTCILIRTMVVKDGLAYLQAGAGLVYDSEPEKEFEETVNKARALMKAIDFAEQGLQS